MEWVLLLLLPLLLIAAAAVGYYYGRGIEKPAEDVVSVPGEARGRIRAASEKTRGWAGATADRTRDWAGTARGWLRIGRSKKEPEGFVAWVASLPGMDKAFKAWLEGLAPEEAEVFAQRAASFVSGLEIELAWLLDGRIDGDPELKRMIEEAMALYCLAYWKAARVQEDAEAFAAFQAWQDDPKKYKELSQRLFARLVEDGSASAPPELYLASEKDRWNHIMEAIRDFAEKDRQALIVLFKEVLDGSPSASESAPAGKPPTEGKKSRRGKSTPSPDTAKATA